MEDPSYHYRQTQKQLLLKVLICEVGEHQKDVTTQEISVYTKAELIHTQHIHWRPAYWSDINVSIAKTHFPAGKNSVKTIAEQYPQLSLRCSKKNVHDSH